MGGDCEDEGSGACVGLLLETDDGARTTISAGGGESNTDEAALLVVVEVDVGLAVFEGTEVTDLTVVALVL